MTSTELRQSFLDFFASKQHTIVPSAPLLPSSPNLLFTNAGMNQFVPYFLGERPAPYPRAADTQKCIRAGGKHNDLEDVGFDTYHHTFFEMLGNWSFGDYFKKEAITWAWELLTEVWKLPVDRLYVTVYEPGPGDPASFDHEAADYWKVLLEKAGLDPEVHIITGNKKDNFWMMGDTGPCGPCSEVHIDLTPKGDTRGSLVNADSPLCIEIWNLVFIQFNAEPDGTFKPLAAKHVDTGMGFERVAGIMASTHGFKDFSKPPSNYAADLFTDCFQRIAELCGKTYQGTVPSSRERLTEQEKTDVAFRVLADHSRTIACAIADGILPGNDGRNYVIRRILRRGILYGKKLGLETGFFEKLVDPVVQKLGGVFPELKEQEDIIRRVIRSEEESFGRTLDRGLQLFEKVTVNGATTVSGVDAFTLYDTYGFPLDMTQLLAHERGLSVDIHGFDHEMNKQREMARAAQKKTVVKVSEGDEEAEATNFTGYDLKNVLSSTAEVVDVVKSDEATYLVYDESPFYAEMGGQVGDSGYARIGGSEIRIINTIKDKSGRHLHRIDGTLPDHLIGETADLTVDMDRRRAIQRHHSATHLLNYALRSVLGTHVRQAGSLVTEDRLRFDFSHFEALKDDELQRIENIVNDRILDNAHVRTYETEFDKKPENCLAFFGEKYGAIVRVVDIGGYSVELCGGTHVSTTGEIGLVKIVSESAIASGTRRLEAVAGGSALAFTDELQTQIRQLSAKLGVPVSGLNKKLEQLLEQKADVEKELKAFHQKAEAGQAADLAEKAIDRDGVPLVVATAAVGNPNDLRNLGNQVLGRLGEGLVILGANIGEKASVVVFASPKAVTAGHKAGAIVKALTAKIGGTGGGKPEFAMGGGKASDDLGAVLRSY